MYDKNPDCFNEAKLIKSINVSDLKKYDADFSTQSNIGTGGFSTKMQAIRRATLSGTYTVIASGYEDDILNKIFTKSYGTLFIPELKKVSSKKQWLDTTENQGAIIIDKGACKALNKNSSLLFVGIKNIINSFEKGDVINCMNEKNICIAKGITNIINSFEKGDVINCMNEKNVCIAKGITNYGSDDIALLKGQSSENIISQHGGKYTKEVIHTDNLIVIEI